MSRVEADNDAGARLCESILLSHLQNFNLKIDIDGNSQSETLPSDRFCFRPHGITIVNSTMFHIDNEMFNLVLLLNKIIYALY